MNILADMMALAEFFESAAYAERVLCVGFVQAHAVAVRESESDWGVGLSSSPPCLLPFLYRHLAMGTFSPFEPCPVFVSLECAFQNAAGPSGTAKPALGSALKNLSQKQVKFLESTLSLIRKCLRRWLVVPLTVSSGDLTKPERLNALSHLWEQVRIQCERLGFAKVVFMPDWTMGARFLAGVESSSKTLPVAAEREFALFFINWVRRYWLLPGELGVFTPNPSHGSLLWECASQVAMEAKFSLNPQESQNHGVEWQLREPFRLGANRGNVSFT